MVRPVTNWRHGSSVSDVTKIILALYKAVVVSLNQARLGRRNLAYHPVDPPIFMGSVRVVADKRELVGCRRNTHPFDLRRGVLTLTGKAPGNWTHIPESRTGNLHSSFYIH